MTSVGVRGVPHNNDGWLICLFGFRLLLRIGLEGRNPNDDLMMLKKSCTCCSLLQKDEEDKRNIPTELVGKYNSVLVFDDAVVRFLVSLLGGGCNAIINGTT